MAGTGCALPRAGGARPCGRPERARRAGAALLPGRGGLPTAESTVLFGDDGGGARRLQSRADRAAGRLRRVASAGLYFMLAWCGAGRTGGLFLGLCCSRGTLFYHENAGQILLADDFMLLKRIEYAAGAFAPYLFMDLPLFPFARRRGNMGRVEKAAMLFINAAAVASIVPFFASDTILLWDRWMYTAAEPLLVAPVAMSYRVLAAGTAADRRSATIIIAGYTICVAAVAHDVLVHRALIDNAPVGQWPFLVFVIALQQMMGRSNRARGKARADCHFTEEARAPGGRHRLSRGALQQAALAREPRARAMA